MLILERAGDGDDIKLDSDDSQGDSPSNQNNLDTPPNDQ